MPNETTDSPSFTNPWADWSDQQLRDYEAFLYEREVAGEDTWAERDQVLWEMNARGLCK